MKRAEQRGRWRGKNQKGGGLANGYSSQRMTPQNRDRVGNEITKELVLINSSKLQERKAVLAKAVA